MGTVGNERIPITKEFFPDDNFREFIKKEIAKGSKTLTPFRIKQTTQMVLYMPEVKIEHIKGIELFPYLTEVMMLGLKDVQDAQLLELLPELKMLNFAGSNVSTLNFNKLNKNLEALKVGECDITELDVSGLPNLKSLWCPYNPRLKEINFGEKVQLEELHINRTAIKTIDISSLPSLERFNAIESGIESIDFSSGRSLEIVNMNGSPNLMDITLPKSNIRDVILDNTKIKKLDISNCPLLKSISLSNIKGLKKIDASGCKELGLLVSSDSDLERINLNGCTELHSICVSNNQLKKIDFSDCENLRSINIKNNPIEKIDISKSKKVKELFTSGCPLREINCSKSQLRSLF